MGLRLEITSVDKDLSRAPSLCCSHNLCLRFAGEQACRARDVSRGLGCTMTQRDREDPGHRMHPHGDAQIEPERTPQAEFDVIDMYSMRS